jgi:hypothetical protein
VDEARSWLALLAVITGCETETMPSTASVSDAAVELGGEVDSGAASPTAVADAGNGVEFRARWCRNEGRDPGERTAALARVARDYEAARTDDCRTRGLLPELEESQLFRWVDYLIGYSSVMLGCPFRPTPVPGGILRFGPANTTAIGLSPPPIGRDDADLLVLYYLASLSASVSLSEAELAHVQQQLRETSELAIDPTVSAGLSTCSRDGAR